MYKIINECYKSIPTSIYSLTYLLFISLFFELDLGLTKTLYELIN